MGELALSVGARAGAPLKLTTHFQGQPFGVPAHGHADGHEVSLQTKIKVGGVQRNGRGVTVMSEKSPAKEKRPTEERRCPLSFVQPVQIENEPL